MRPIIVNLQKVSEEAARASALAAAQVDRLDALVASVARRVEDTAATLQQTILQPARDGLALLTASRASLPASASRASRERRRRRPRRRRAAARPAAAAHAPADDELFIG